MALGQEYFSKRPMLFPSLFVALILLGSLGSWPYGYYVFLRWVTCATSIIFAFYAFSLDKVWVAWTLGFVAILFNPLIPIHLSREVWLPIDIVLAVFFIVLSLVFTSNKDVRNSD